MDDALLLQKYHGLGNDYLVLDPNKNKIHLLERHIVKLCRRDVYKRQAVITVIIVITII